MHAQRKPDAGKIAAVNRSRSFCMCMPVLELGEDGRALQLQRIAFSQTSELDDHEESCLLKLYKNVKNWGRIF